MASRRGLVRQEIWIFLFYVGRLFEVQVKKEQKLTASIFLLFAPAETVTTVTTIYWAIPSHSLSLSMHVCMHAVCFQKIEHNIIYMYTHTHIEREREREREREGEREREYIKINTQIDGAKNSGSAKRKFPNGVACR